jgi:hypothetical protein
MLRQPLDEEGIRYTDGDIGAIIRYQKCWFEPGVKTVTADFAFDACQDLIPDAAACHAANHAREKNQGRLRGLKTAVQMGSQTLSPFVGPLKRHVSHDLVLGTGVRTADTFSPHRKRQKRGCFQRQQLSFWGFSTRFSTVVENFLGENLVEWYVRHGTDF